MLVHVGTFPLLWFLTKNSWITWNFHRSKSFDINLHPKKKVQWLRKKHEKHQNFFPKVWRDSSSVKFWFKLNILKTSISPVGTSWNIRSKCWHLRCAKWARSRQDICLQRSTIFLEAIGSACLCSLVVEFAIDQAIQSSLLKERIQKLKNFQETVEHHPLPSSWS